MCSSEGSIYYNDNVWCYRLITGFVALPTTRYTQT